MKKFLTALFIGAFVFGVGATNIQTANAESPLDKIKETQDKLDKQKKKFDEQKDKFDRAREQFSGDKSDRPEPPKDENGNPLPPPDRDGDNSNRPEPPKDANGNPMAPPNHDGDNSNVRK
ncbi:MAG: hypothetical protein IKP64_01365 [Selenomonadaceae bacterium]|nr:hypothetical protein [Selenomonadaceae bacterium]MBR4382183.1 hypothetical protein [Selenomonadaceae bacterium]